MQFLFDIACPYAYLASRRVAQLSGAVPVDWMPVVLGGLYGSTTAPQGKDGSATDVMPAAKKALYAADLVREAERQRAPLVWNPKHPVRTVDALRLLVATPPPTRPQLALALYSAYWERGEDVSDDGVLTAIGERFGVDATARHTADVKAQLHANTEYAVSVGAFGVPVFVVNGRMFWGQDRLHRALVHAGYGHHPLALPLRLTPSNPRPATPRRLTVYHDFSSPWSFVAARLLPEVAKANGAVLEWKPVLVGAIFKAIGTPNVPMLAMPEAKRAYLAKDLEDHATAAGTAFRFPSKFPIRSVTALRVSIVEPRTLPAVYTAAWEHDTPISDDGVLAAVLTDAGFDGDALVAAASAPEVKAALRANTEEAVAAGACGVPSFVADTAPDVLIWGQDRLHVVEDLLNGWQPGMEHATPTARL